jgi:hypothetical protein
MAESLLQPIDPRLAATLLALVLAVSSISAAAADETAATASDPSISAASIDPVFDCYRANSAWGLSYSGKVIDRNGWIWSYGTRGKTLPEAQRDHDRNYYQAADLLAKYAGGTRGSRIEDREIAEHAAQIEKADAGTVTSTDTGVRDAGTSTCHAYVFDAATRHYRDVELGSDGGVADRRFVNDSPQATSLIDWLRSVGVAR